MLGAGRPLCDRGGGSAAQRNDNSGSCSSLLLRLWQPASNGSQRRLGLSGVGPKLRVDAVRAGGSGLEQVVRNAPEVGARIVSSDGAPVRAAHLRVADHVLPIALRFQSRLGHGSTLSIIGGEANGLPGSRTGGRTASIRSARVMAACQPAAGSAATGPLSAGAAEEATPIGTAKVSSHDWATGEVTPAASAERLAQSSGVGSPLFGAGLIARWKSSGEAMVWRA